MIIHAIPAHKGISEEDLKGRLGSGWQYIGRVAVQGGSEIVVPGQPQMAPGVQEVDVRVLPEPTMPVQAIAQAVLAASQAYPEAQQGLNMVTEPLFGLKIDDFVAQMLGPAPEAPEIPLVA